MDASGLLVSLGVMVSPGDGGESFIEDVDFSVRMDITQPGYDVSNIRTAVTGFFFVLENGEVITRDDRLHQM